MKEKQTRTADGTNDCNAENLPVKGKKKAGKIVGVVLSSLFLIIALSIFANTLYYRARGQQPKFFGYYFSVVATDSMTPEIKVGDMIIVKSCDISKAEKGQNVVFTSLSGYLKGNNIVHKAIEVGEDEQGRYIVTQGVKQGAPVDTDKVRADNFVGIAVTNSAFLGKIVVFFSKFENWLLIIVLVAVAIFASHQIKKIISASKEDKDDDEKVDDPDPSEKDKEE